MSRMMLYKYMFWKNGIPPSVFWEQDIEDVKDIIEIDNAISQKQINQATLNNAVNEMRKKYG